MTRKAQRFEVLNHMMRPTPIAFWTLANLAIRAGRITKPRVDIIRNRHTTDGLTDWAGAIAQLRQEIDGNLG